MSLKHKQGSLNWKPEMLDMKRFTIIDGPDGTGDLFLNYEFLINFILSKHPDGLDLAVADGGADVSETDMPQNLTDKEKKKLMKMNYRRHEYLHTRLILVQMYVAVKTLKEGCHTFIKIFDAVNPLTAQMFYLFSLCFEKIVIFKPLSSRPANAERYLLGLEKKNGKGLDLCMNIFEKALKSYTKDKEVVKVSSLG
jgi:cap1 methyltransferase